QRQTFYVDVFNRGQTPFQFSASAEPWVRIEPSRGTVTKEQRVSVSIDWTRVPQGMNTASVTFSGPSGARSSIRVNAKNPATPSPESVVRFVEGNGYVSMEAEHYTRAVTANGISSWRTIPDLGRTLSAVEAMPVTAPVQTPGNTSARLEYNVLLFDSGTVKV